MTEPISVLTQIKDKIKKSQNIVVLLPSIANLDSAGSALAMTLALQKLGKSVTISSSADFSTINLENKNLIRTNIVTSGDELLISFPYTDGAVEKVSYNIDEKNNRFNLVIAPYKGYPRLDTADLKYEFVGGKADLIIIFDCPALTSLGELYTKNNAFFAGVDIINIDRHFNNAAYATINLVNKSSSSLSEMTYEVLQNLEVEIDAAIATNILQGLMQATKNLTAYNVSPSSLELAATLMRQGGKKAAAPTPSTATGPMNMPGATPRALGNPFGSGLAPSRNAPLDPYGGFDDFGDFGDIGLPPMNQGQNFGNMAPLDDLGDFDMQSSTASDPYSDPYLGQPSSLPAMNMPTLPTVSPISTPIPSPVTPSTNRVDVSPQDSPTPILNSSYASPTPNATPLDLNEISSTPSNDDTSAPDDWLKPKIFRPPTSPSPSGMTS